MKEETYQSTQTRRWSNVAPSWKRWWKTFDAGGQGVNQWLVDAAGLAPGMRVLDVACGLGEPALTAARRIGADGRVIAVDFADGMLREASRRRTEAGLDNVDFVRMDGQALALRDSCMDAAVSRWGIMLIESPIAALASIHRVLRPGGHVAAAVWADPSDAPFLSIPGQATHAVLGLDAPSPDAPGPFRLAREGALEELFADAGFDVTLSAAIHATFEFESRERYIELENEMSSSLRQALDQHPPEAQARVWQDIRERVSGYTLSNGRVRFDNKLWCVAARRPG